MSNDRCVSHYLPLVAYVAPRQMAKRGDLWPYSTRAVEARGGRYKRISRRVNHRKRSALDIKAVQNLKLGTVNFKKSAYNSSRTLQMSRAACMQEESAHGSHGRSRLATTGRNTLVRTLPKWLEAELPPMGQLLDPDALTAMLARAATFFDAPSADGFFTEAVLPTSTPVVV